MTIYTIGFTKSSAKNFFERIKNAKPNIIIDVRRNNSSQLAGFAKGEDIAFFLKEICDCDYIHDVVFAPSEVLLEDYKHKKTSWNEYELKFTQYIKKENIVRFFIKNYGKYTSVCLLCSEDTPEKCHRRLLAENISKESGAEIIHL